MAIWLTESSKIIVQGMTGSEGMKHTTRLLAPGAQAVGPNGHARFAGYILQVGAYRDEAQAHKVVNYLDSLGILAHINPMRSGGATLYRVRIGPIVEQRELERFRGVLKRIGLPGVLIPGATH